jgi:hypothetical protein
MGCLLSAHARLIWVVALAGAEISCRAINCVLHSAMQAEYNTWVHYVAYDIVQGRNLMEPPSYVLSSSDWGFCLGNLLTCEQRLDLDHATKLTKHVSLSFSCSLILSRYFALPISAALRCQSRQFLRVPYSSRLDIAPSLHQRSEQVRAWRHSSATHVT